MNRKTKMAYNAEAKWLIWQKLILCDYYTHTVVYIRLYRYCQEDNLNITDKCFRLSVVGGLVWVRGQYFSQCASWPSYDGPKFFLLGRAIHPTVKG